MSRSDYPDYKAQKPRKHRLTVGDATFIVTSNVDGDKRWIREVHHVRRHRSGSSADVCIYPNGGRKPSATLSSLWAHLGIDPAARWKECAADHPAFPTRRSIETALDHADDSRKASAAAAVLVAAGWTWAEGENERWIAPPAQGIDLVRALDIMWNWQEQLGGHVFDARDVARTLTSSDMRAIGVDARACIDATNRSQAIVMAKREIVRALIDGQRGAAGVGS